MREGPSEPSYRRRFQTISRDLDRFVGSIKRRLACEIAPDRTPDPIWRFVESEIGRQRRGNSAFRQTTRPDQEFDQERFGQVGLLFGDPTK
jgi:hypothetical protein